MTAPVRHLAAADCERIRPGFLAQPANALSSLAATVAGAVVGKAIAERPAQADAAAFRRAALWATAAAIAANGPGGLAYHGPGGRAGHLLHDGALAATVGGVVVIEVTDVVRRGPGAGLRRLAGPGVVIGLGAILHARSRTGQPWCRPDTWCQGHAGWHLLSAVALGWWGVRAARG